MIYLSVISILVLLFMIWLIYMSIRYSNPYKLIMIFGKKGAGKTTYLCKLTQQFLRKGRPVYSTCDIPGAYRIQGTDVGNVQFPPESVILMDEVGMLYDNRNWKNGNMTPAVRDYFKLQRHYRHTVYLFSQAWDIDVKLRNLTDSMYLLINYFGFWTVGKQIKRRIVVVKPSEESESRIADELVISPFLMTPFGARIFVYVPHWVKFFNSYDAPVLASKDFFKVSYPDDVMITKRGKVKFKSSGINLKSIYIQNIFKIDVKGRFKKPSLSDLDAGEERNRIQESPSEKEEKPRKERRRRKPVRRLGNLMPGALWAALIKRPLGQEPAPARPLENDRPDGCGAGTEGPLDYPMEQKQSDT